MKKIISILVALGLVLSLSVMATPVAADVTAATVVVVDPCAGSTATYNITFNTTASLTEGVHSVTIAFPADTSIPSPVPDGAITINGNSVFGSEVTVSGTTVTFLTPLDILAGPISVFFNKLIAPTAWAITNPTTEGTYNLYVNTSRAPDETPVKSADYDISPAISLYEFVWDSNPTYPGIAEDFVPPFKACGQNTTGAVENTTWTVHGFANAFNLTLATAGLPGCAVPCTNATVWFELKVAPVGATVHLNIGGTWFNLGLPDPPNTSVGVVANVTLTMNYTITWESLLHFDSVGDYEICFYLECPTAPVCLPPGSEIIAERCIEFEVYQWKDAYEIPLYRKWNLISLPLVPFETDIDAVLAAYPGAAEVDSIWHYDRCSDAWSTYAGAGLTDIYDGKSYWVKIAYSHTDPTKAPGLPVGVLWVWGTEAPMPPDGPSAYAVCEGWNMVGFRSMVSRNNTAYLWNFVYPGPVYGYGMIYEWTAATQTWATTLPGAFAMDSGKGYWIPFSVNGNIYP